jgi:hypothetical protein
MPSHGPVFRTSPEPIVGVPDQFRCFSRNMAADPSLREWRGARVGRRTVEEPVAGARKDDDRPVLAAFAFE